MLRCPVCRQSLQKTEHKTMVCQNGHSFDISKKGYTNLLLVHKTHSKLPGDNKQMVDARSDFLNQGYYAPLLEELKQLIDSYSPKTVLDAGCGEGYYTNGIYHPSRSVVGIDISKLALQKAAPRNRNITYLTASLFDLPIHDKSVDLLFSLFAPYAGEEFYRVLEEGGIMILGIPGEDHLWELKSVIYEHPYKNQVKEYSLPPFRFIQSKKIYTKILLQNPKDIQNLFKMTPYYYRTKKEDLEKINHLKTFEVTIAFELLVYQK